MKSLLLNLIKAIAVLGITSQAVANISLSLEPSAQAVNVGDPVSVAIVISGLGKFSPPSLGAFSLDLNYNSAAISADSVTFGNYLDLGNLGSSRFSDLSTLGTIHLDEVSFESDTDLNGAQPDTFTLGTLGFNGIGPGTSSIDFTLASLSDELGDSLLQFTTTVGRIEVKSTQSVPEASTTGFLLPIGLASLLVFAANKQRTGPKFRPWLRCQ